MVFSHSTIFLSTSANRRVALQFTDSAQGKDDMTGILFRITIDPLISSTPFASLNSNSHFGDSENEILSSMHTVFRIGELNQLDTKLWQVNLTTTSDKDEQLTNLSDYIQDEIDGRSDSHQLASFMRRMAEMQKAERFCKTLLNMTSGDDKKRTSCYLL